MPTVSGSNYPFCGPYKDSTGKYFFFSFNATGTALASYKATDPSVSWAAGATVGLTQSMAMIRGVQVGDTIWLAYATGNSSANGAVRFNRFDMSSETFVAEEVVASAMNTTTSASQLMFRCDLAYRSDGSCVVIYNSAQAAVMGSSYSRVSYRIRSTSGTWGTVVALDAAGQVDYICSAIEIGSSNRTHLFYRDLTTVTVLHHRALTSADSLQANSDGVASSLSNEHSTLSYDSGGGVISVLVLGTATGGGTGASVSRGNSADSVTWTAGTSFGTNVLTSAGNNILVDGTDLWAVYRNSSDGDVYIAKSIDGGATFTSPVIAVIGTVTAFNSVDRPYQRGSTIYYPIIVQDSTNVNTSEYFLRALASPPVEIVMAPYYQQRRL